MTCEHCGGPEHSGWGAERAEECRDRLAAQLVESRAAVERLTAMQTREPMTPEEIALLDRMAEKTLGKLSAANADLRRRLEEADRGRASMFEDVKTVHVLLDAANRRLAEAEREAHAADRRVEAADRRTNEAGRQRDAANRRAEEAERERDDAEEAIGAWEKLHVQAIRERDAANRRAEAAEKHNAAVEGIAERAGHNEEEMGKMLVAALEAGDVVRLCVPVLLGAACVYAMKEIRPPMNKGVQDSMEKEAKAALAACEAWLEGNT